MFLEFISDVDLPLPLPLLCFINATHLPKIFVISLLVLTYRQRKHIPDDGEEYSFPLAWMYTNVSLFLMLEN